ncbi:hypothetical protein IV102_19755 [bacterium]|nr:hypothetical protein [bacterium]
MTRWMIGLVLTLGAWAQPVVWNVTVPPHWTSAAGSSDGSLVMQLHPKDPSHTASVVIRRYPQELPSLTDELQQLRYSVILKLEGRIFKSRPCLIAGQPGLRVDYEGRTDSGAFKKFVRYMTTYHQELLTVHCAVSSQAAADEADFKAILEGIRATAAAADPE